MLFLSDNGPTIDKLIPIIDATIRYFIKWHPLEAQI